MNKILASIWVLWEWIWSFLPGRIGMMVRKITIAPFLSYSGSRIKMMWFVKIPEFVHFWMPWNVTVGKNVRFGKYSQVNAVANIFIGSNVMMGPYVMLTTLTHGYKRKDVPMMKQENILQSITVEDDVWIGGHVSIMPGVRIKSGIIVGAGAVVAKSLDESFGIYVGVPAILKSRR